MLNVAARRRTRTVSKSVRETNIAVKTLETKPKNNVVAKPLIGPEPNWKRNAA